MARSTNILLACVAMPGAMLLAVEMTPHQLMARTHDVFNINQHLPTEFGDWKPVEGLNVVTPPPADSLEATLYNQEASRGFVDPDGHVVMLMVAYGESQSDRLQLHHPEVCYTAQGFRVSRTSSVKVGYSPSAPPLNVTRLVAAREERVEPISYWMRVGYDNSNSNWARQALKLGYGLRGWVPDGALFRVSTIGLPAELSFKIQDKFIHDLLNSVDPATREFMVGDPAKALL
ncbi:MAG TPA: EpsI family protein [Roseiarcus sp.]|jgi:EpsI family protein|nr:EpsI family protein [Roseiarcus sp.]